MLSLWRTHCSSYPSSLPLRTSSSLPPVFSSVPNSMTGVATITNIFLFGETLKLFMLFPGYTKAQCSSLSPSWYFYTDNLKAMITCVVLFLGTKPYCCSQMFTFVFSLASAALLNILIVCLITFIPLKLLPCTHFSVILQALSHSQHLFD